MDKKNQIIFPTIIAVLLLIVLVVSATYAYINVTTTNNFQTKTIQASIQPMGTVTITGYSYTMNLTRTQVDTPDGDVDETYYLHEDNSVSTEEKSPKIATVTVTGEGTFTCNYKISVSATGGLFENAVGIGTNLLVLKVNSSQEFTHDFYNALSESEKSITGQLTGLKQDSPQDITAQLIYVNSKDTDQSALAGQSGTITFDVTEFNCTPTA